MSLDVMLLLYDGRPGAAEMEIHILNMISLMRLVDGIESEWIMPITSILG